MTTLVINIDGLSRATNVSDTELSELWQTDRQTDK